MSSVGRGKSESSSQEQLKTLISKILPIQFEFDTSSHSVIRFYVQHPVISKVCKELTPLDNFFPWDWGMHDTQFAIERKNYSAAIREFKSFCLENDLKKVSELFDQSLKKEAASYLQKELNKNLKYLSKSDIDYVNKDIMSIPEKNTKSVIDLLIRYKKKILDLKNSASESSVAKDTNSSEADEKSSNERPRPPGGPR